MLQQIRDYIRQEGLVSNQQICRALKLDISALDPMLDFLMQRNAIQCAPGTKACGSCSRCPELAITYYIGLTQNPKVEA